MIEKDLAMSFNISPEIVPKDVVETLNKLASQVSMQERETLYSLTCFEYTGEGEIWDIGCAAGGSSYPLAMGLQNNTSLTSKNNVVKCFDLFSGHFSKTFEEQYDSSMTDLEIFHEQTKPVKEYVKAEKLDLVTQLGEYELNRPIEIAHIDAAKSLDLWKSIFSKISVAIIPNKTIWIFQDFERCRLPWQAYALVELLEFGEIIGGADYGTIYFRFHSKISESQIKKIANDDFTLEERLENVQFIYEKIRKNYSSFFECFDLFDVENTTIAYCYYWNGDKKRALETLQHTSPGFLNNPCNQVYEKEIRTGKLS